MQDERTESFWTATFDRNHRMLQLVGSQVANWTIGLLPKMPEQTYLLFKQALQIPDREEIKLKTWQSRGCKKGASLNSPEQDMMIGKKLAKVLWCQYASKLCNFPETKSTELTFNVIGNQIVHIPDSQNLQFLECRWTKQALWPTKSMSISNPYTNAILLQFYSPHIPINFKISPLTNMLGAIYSSQLNYLLAHLWNVGGNTCSHRKNMSTPQRKHQRSGSVLL